MVFGASRAGVGADTRAQGDIDPSACIETSSHAPRQEPLSRKTKPKDDAHAEPQSGPYNILHGAGKPGIPKRAGQNGGQRRDGDPDGRAGVKNIPLPKRKQRRDSQRPIEQHAASADIITTDTNNVLPEMFTQGFVREDNRTEGPPPEVTFFNPQFRRQHRLLPWEQKMKRE